MNNLFKLILDLTQIVSKLLVEIESMTIHNQALSTTIQRQGAMIAELEGKVQGYRANYPYIESIELCADIPEARQVLKFYSTQEGFFGGRILGSGKSQVRLQTFWTDDDAPASWMTAYIRDQQLPDNMKHVIIPPFLQRTILLYTEMSLKEI